MNRWARKVSLFGHRVNFDKPLHWHLFLAGLPPRGSRALLASVRILSKQVLDCRAMWSYRPELTKAILKCLFLTREYGKGASLWQII